MQKQATSVWSGQMAFTAITGSGHKVEMDALPEVGGSDGGPRPKELLLVALGGCTGMDIVSMLRKMRAPLDRFEVYAEGDEVDAHPKVLGEIRVVYRLWGPEGTLDKALRAIDLSWTKYCSVTHTLNKAARVTHRVEFNGQPVAATGNTPPEDPPS